MSQRRKPRVLVDLRPAFDGFAGIPQEARLMFATLLGIDAVEASGLLHHGDRFLRLPQRSPKLKLDPPAEAINEAAQLIALLTDTRHRMRFARLRGRILPALAYSASCLAGRPAPIRPVELREFHDFVWQMLFSKSLRLDDFDAVTGAPYAVLEPSWGAMVEVSLSSYLPNPKVATGDYDYLIGHTPWPGRLTGDARLIVRYHDAIPMFEPHTIQNKVRHQRQHFKNLVDNSRGGAFACVSEATRNSLLKILPEAEASAHVVPNSISAQFHEQVPDLQRAIEIIQTKQVSASYLPEGHTLKAPDYQRDLADTTGYLLMVSSFEPRKNHRLALAAWEGLRERHPGLKLVLVGSAQWDHAPLMNSLAYWIRRGEVAILSNVPAAQLRRLYASAVCVVCPSVAEGFDYSGLEAMACGAVVAASDIPVHRETFGDSAAYFNPYSSEQAVDAIERLIGDGQQALRSDFRERGLVTASRYSRAIVAERWAAFFETLERERRG